MSQPKDENTPATQQDREAQQQEMEEIDERLDAESDGDGLAAEAGRSEETGISEG